MTQRRWLITGCSSGLGRALAERLAASGERVLATARDASSLDDLAGYGPHVATAALDVCDAGQCSGAVSLAVDRFGGVDILVNNAGYGQFGVVEEVSDAELAAQFDVIVHGPWRLLRHVLPLWRAQGGGHAMFSSSLSGSIAFPGLSAYTAAKFALEGLAEALAAEARHLGVRVTILQLGGFATSYGTKLRESPHRIAEYQPVVADMLAMLRALGDDPELSRPSLFAEVVQSLAGMPDPPFRLPLGTGAFEYLDQVMTARRAEFDRHRAVRAPDELAAQGSAAP